MIIVDSMTYEEIVKLFEEKEKPLIMHKIAEAGKNLRRLIKNTRNIERRYFTPIKFSSSRGFNVTIQCYDEGINYPRHQRLGAFYYAWFRRNRGIYLLTYSLMQRTEWHYSVYTPHFLDRYNERFLKDPSLSKPDIIDVFMENNRKVSAMRLKAEDAKYENEYWITCNDGLCFCINPFGFFVEVKTFISWDMLKIDQQEFALNAKEFMRKHGFDLRVPDEDFDDFIEE